MNILATDYCSINLYTQTQHYAQHLLTRLWLENLPSLFNNKQTKMQLIYCPS